MYAQVFNPQAIQYREKKKLVNTPERMGIIIQIIRGHRVGNYFFPDLSGFSVSQSSTRWDHAMRLGGLTAILNRRGEFLCGSADEVITEENLRDIYQTDIR